MRGWNEGMRTLGRSAGFCGAALLVADVAWQQVVGRGGLAEVVAEAGVANGQLRAEPRCGVEHHHQMHTRINLRVVVGALRHAPKTIDLGQ